MGKLDKIRRKSEAERAARAEEDARIDEDILLGEDTEEWTWEYPPGTGSEAFSAGGAAEKKISGNLPLTDGKPAGGGTAAGPAAGTPEGGPGSGEKNPAAASGTASASRQSWVKSKISGVLAHMDADAFLKKLRKKLGESGFAKLRDQVGRLGIRKLKERLGRSDFEKLRKKLGPEGMEELKKRIADTGLGKLSIPIWKRFKSLRASRRGENFGKKAADYFNEKFGKKAIDHIKSYVNKKKEIFAVPEDSFAGFLLAILRKSMQIRMTVLYDGKRIFGIPVLLLVLGTAFAFWVTVPLLGAGLVFGYRYGLEGTGNAGAKVEKAFSRAARKADKLQEKLRLLHQELLRRRKQLIRRKRRIRKRKIQLKKGNSSGRS